jgi:MOSC domain-containing protein YiiM
VSLNVATAEVLGGWRGQPVRSGIRKRPAAGPVEILLDALAGDEQADRVNHGGPDKAIYAYAQEDYGWWTGELAGESLMPGRFGENLTTGGIDVSGALIGERWRVGAALLEVAQPRIPCFKLGMTMRDAGFLRRFAHASRPGAYLRIIERAPIAAGDAIDVVERPAHEVSVARVSDAILLEDDPSTIAAVLEAVALAAGLADWLRDKATALAARAA